LPDAAVELLIEAALLCPDNLCVIQLHEMAMPPVDTGIQWGSMAHKWDFTDLTPGKVMSPERWEIDHQESFQNKTGHVPKKWQHFFSPVGSASVSHSHRTQMYTLW